nr:MAG TPA: hypothetical protein [Caudoviricetes sp.]
MNVLLVTSILKPTFVHNTSTVLVSPNTHSEWSLLEG